MVSADGRKVLISSDNGPPLLWKPRPTAAPAVLTAAGNARAVDVTPDGRYVLMETHGQPSIFDLSENRTLPLPAGGQHLTAGRFSPDGNLVALGDTAGNFVLLDWRNNKLIVGTRLARA